MSGMARPVKRKNAKAPVPAAGAPSAPGTASRRLPRAGARLRRSADIALVVLGLAAIGLFVATRIIGGRPDVSNASGKKNGGTASSATIGPDNGAETGGLFADLEPGPEEL